jgi:LPXTG-motif cell wall-anchored protein
MDRSGTPLGGCLVSSLAVVALVGPAAAAPSPPTTTVPASPTPTAGVASGSGLASLGIALVLIGATLLYLRRRTRA